MNMPAKNPVLDFIDDVFEESRGLIVQLRKTLVPKNRRYMSREEIDSLYRNFHTLKAAAEFFPHQPLTEVCDKVDKLLSQIRRQPIQPTVEMLRVLRVVIDHIECGLQDRENHFDPPTFEAGFIEQLDTLALACMPEKTVWVNSSDDDIEGYLEEICTENPSETVHCFTDEPRRRHPRIKPDVAQIEPQQLDIMMHSICELMQLKSAMQRDGQPTSTRLPEAYNLQHVQVLERTLDQLKSHYTALTQRSLGDIFNHIEQKSSDIAKQFGKSISLQCHSEALDIEKKSFNALTTTLLHLTQNAIEYGIEPVEVRKQHNKSDCGKIVLHAQQIGDYIAIAVSDDGAGFDHQKLRQLALQNNLLDSYTLHRLSARECNELAFLAGVSSQYKSGQNARGRVGWGLYEAKALVEELGGEIAIASTLGAGTTVSIKVPLKASITAVALFDVGEHTFGVPAALVCETFALDDTAIHYVGTQAFVRYQGKAMPLFNLLDWLVDIDESHRFVPHKATDSPSYVVAINIAEDTVALVVERIRAPQEAVIKPLGARLGESPYYAGAAVTRGGQLSLLLNTPVLLEEYMLNMAC